jgi:hypothetical protein
MSEADVRSPGINVIAEMKSLGQRNRGKLLSGEDGRLVGRAPHDRHALGWRSETIVIRVGCLLPPLHETTCPVVDHFVPATF